MKHLGVAVSLVICAGAFPSPTSARAEGPAQLVSIDPLTLPAPTLLEPMRLAPDSRSPAEKVQPMLWEEALKRGADELIPIIVTLHEPQLPESLRGTTPEADEHRTQWVAALAHEFAPLAAQNGMRSLRALSHLPILFGSARSADLPRVARIVNVAAIQLDGEVHAMRVEGGALMNATTLRNSFGANGAGIEVAVIDSGVFPHSEFGSRIRAGGDFTSEGLTGLHDGTGHGTSVAGIIAGSSGGMAPQAGIWAMKVFLTTGGTAQESWIVSALNSAYANRNDFGGLDAINMSLGSGGPINSDCDALNPAYAAALNQLVAAGIPVFVASGNDGFTTGISFPACLSNVIAVGAVYDSDFGLGGVGYPGPPQFCPDATTAADQITCFSNSGHPLDILAPSEKCHTPTTLGGYNEHFGGTSAASPYAAGVAAQILSLRPLTTPAQLKSALMSTGRPITDVNGITRNRIDAVEAFQALSGGGGGPCVEDSDTACLLNDRFKIEIEWTDFQAVTRDANVASAGTPDSALFYFQNPNNWEFLIKAIDACGFNQKFWIFFAAATNVGYRVTVTDTVAGGSPKVYTNPVGNLAQAVNDINAFNCP